MSHCSKSILIAVLLFVVALLLLFFRNTAAQESRLAALPLPAMQKLSKLYVGRWEYSETYPKFPMAPNGGTNTGVYSSELGPGGNSIFNHFHSKGPVGEFDGTLVMTWDPKEQAYKMFVFSDSFPGAIVETGQFEDDALVYRAELSMGPAKVAMRNVTKFLPDGKISSDQFTSVNGAPESLLVHVAAVKK